MTDPVPDGAEDGACFVARYIDDHVIALPLPAPELMRRPAPRLRLATGPAGRGALDGGWWPRSRDATAELTELVKALSVPPDTVVRLRVDTGDWDEIPRRLFAGGRVTRVGWLPNLDHLVTVTFGRMDEIMLLVVPPGAAEDAATSALEMAAVGSDSVRPQEILAACDISTVRAATAQGPGEARVMYLLTMDPDETDLRPDDGALPRPAD